MLLLHLHAHQALAHRSRQCRKPSWKKTSHEAGLRRRWRFRLLLVPYTGQCHFISHNEARFLFIFSLSLSSFWFLVFSLCYRKIYSTCSNERMILWIFFFKRSLKIKSIFSIELFTSEIFVEIFVMYLNVDNLQMILSARIFSCLFDVSIFSNFCWYFF